MPVANSEIIDIDKPFIGRQRNFVFYVECFIDCIPFDRYAAVLQSANHAAADIPRHPDSGRSFYQQQSLEGGAGRLVAIDIPVMLAAAGGRRRRGGAAGGGAQGGGGGPSRRG